jgi:hypothetical protein
MEVSASSQRGCARLAGVVVVTTSSAVWLLLGDLSEDDGYLRIFEVPQLSRPVEAVLGLAIGAAAGLAAARLWQRGRGWLIDDGYWRVYVRLLAAGMIVAAGGRIVTSATVGANIGGGGIMMIGPFVVLYLLERARQEGRKLARRSAPE